jgi:hypothetical protein
MKLIGMIHRVFHRRRAAMLFVVGVSLLAAGAYVARGKGEQSTLWSKEDRSGEIHFSHAKHSDASCTDCHAAATSTSSADVLLPTGAKCRECHDEKDVRAYLNVPSGTPVEQAQLSRAAKPVRFNHAKHLPLAGGECEICHAEYKKIAYSAESPMQLPSMRVCSACHSDRVGDMTAAMGAETHGPPECSTCHESMAGLLPPSHREANYRTTHKRLIRVAGGKENCAACHTDASCQECHSGMGVGSANTATSLIAPFGPRGDAMDNARPMQIQRVHSLTYVATHGLAAAGKSAECATCHETETFCVQCHTSPIDAVGFNPEPASHGSPTFITLGVGSGGGMHATLARRDIEHCAACHDRDGAEPACVKCHVDPDGIKGNNPRTHPAGFFSGSNGEWHSDRGATCYLCHLDANAHPGGQSGVGFCGYCHTNSVKGVRVPHTGGSGR